MISPMTKYDFILLNGEQEGLLEQLQELGLVDISRGSKPVDDASHQLLSEVELIDGLIKGLKGADIPEGTVPEPIDGEIVRLAGGMLMRYAEDMDEIKRLRKELERLRIWGDFDPALLEKLKAAGVPLHFHVCSSKQFKEEWEGEYALSIIGADKSSTYFVVAGDDALPGEVPAPASDYHGMEEKLREKEQHFSRVLARIAGAKRRIPELETLRAEALSKLDLYLAGATAAKAAEDHIVTLEGFASVADEAAITAKLDELGVLYLKEAAKVEENPPISFMNNAFVRLFEPLTDMYGRPAYNGFDPTPFIAVFFMLFFAFCMGDAGYGLLLMLVGLGLRKVEGFKDLSPLVVTLGAGTTLVGFFFHTFFSMNIAEWGLFAPIRGIFLPEHLFGLGNFDAAMVLAILIGVVHICLALIVKTVAATRVKGFLHSLGTWGWTLLIVGGVVVGGIALAGVISAAVTKWIVIILGVVSALGIFIFSDLDRNPLVNIGSGLWETYNTATGLLGDVLSYLRLYALGLAGAKLGEAFNAIGTMILGDGSSVALWIPFILIVVIGHTLNLAMCALGAFVHPLRLNFLEFFKNSGYEAVGRKFNPLSKQ